MIDNAATEQKKQNDLIDLVDGVLDENGQIKPEDICIKENLFDASDSTDIKKVSDDAIQEINFGDNIEIPSDDRVAIDGPKNIKIISNLNSVGLASKRRYQKNIESKDKKEV